MNKTSYIIGIIVSAAIMIVGLVLTAITRLQSVDSTNSYLSQINVSGVIYGVLLGVGFVALATLLQLYLEDRAEL